MKITKIFFSLISNKWYLRIDKEDIEIKESDAKHLIKYYEMDEYNPFNWSKN